MSWFAVVLDIAQVSDQVKMRLISQLINGTSRFLQKLLKYFKGTSTSTFSVPSAPVVPVIFCLNLKQALLPGKQAIAPASVKAGLSLVRITMNFQIFLNNYHYILSKYP